MIRIQKLKRPTKRSGYVLRQGETTKVRGLTITNVSAGKVYVDKWTATHQKKASKK